jgi:hypothetical protein
MSHCLGHRRLGVARGSPSAVSHGAASEKSWSDSRSACPTAVRNCLVYTWLQRGPTITATRRARFSPCGADLAPMPPPKNRTESHGMRVLCEGPLVHSFLLERTALANCSLNANFNSISTRSSTYYGSRCPCILTLPLTIGYRHGQHIIGVCAACRITPRYQQAKSLALFALERYARVQMDSMHVGCSDLRKTYLGNVCLLDPQRRRSRC